MTIVSNRVFDPDLKGSIEYFCERARIKGLEFIPSAHGVLLRVAQKHYPAIVRAVDVIEAANAALEREDARHEAAVNRIAELEEQDLAAIAEAAVQSRKRARAPMRRAA